MTRATASSTKLQDLLSSFRIGIFQTGADGKVLSADLTMQQLLRSPDAETLRNARASDFWPGANETLARAAGGVSTADAASHDDDPAAQAVEPCLLRRYDNTFLLANIRVRKITHRKKVVLEIAVQEVSTQGGDESRLLELARGFSAATGVAFFNALVEQLAQSLEGTYAILGERVYEDGEEKIRTIAAYARGWTLKNFEYAVPGTPSERVLRENGYSCLSGLMQEFPNDPILQRMGGEAYVGLPLVSSDQQAMGLLAVIFRQPQSSIVIAESMLQIFTLRAAAELERRQAQARLEANEIRLRSLLENSGDGLSLLDEQGNIFYTSPSSVRIMGFPLEYHLQKNFSDWVHPDDLKAAAVLYGEIMQNPGKRVPFLFRSQHANGGWHWIEGSGVNLLHDPNIRGTVLNFRDVTERIEAERRIQESDAELRFRADFEQLMIRISSRLIKARTELMIQTLEWALAEVGAFLQIDRCHIYQFSADLTQMSCLVEWNRKGLSGPHIQDLQGIPSNTSPWWYNQLKALEVFTYSSMEEIPAEAKDFRQMAEWLGMQSVINVPITWEGRLIGFLGLASVRRARHWSEDEIALQQLLAEIIANALERRDTEARLNRQLENLASLHTIDRTITSKTELQPVLRVLLEQVTNQLRVDAADILLYSAPSSSLTFGEGRGFLTGSPTSTADHLRLPILQDAIHSHEVRSLSIPREWRALWYDEGFVSYFAVPLIARGQVNGVLELFHRAPIEASEDWLRFMTMLAGQGAIAIDSVTMFHVLQRSNLELKEAYDTTLEGWAQALELRDQETEGHSRRVLWLAERLAEEMGITGEALTHFRRGALLHDIGKMAIPDHILSKPGPLTTEEWEIMRQHPIFAYNLLSKVPFLRQALDVPYCHHERWDGSGYPRGLRGEEIPLAARVFTVVDVWDALRTRRCYREAWDEQAVRSYLNLNSGMQFDPRVVSAFLRMISKGTGPLRYPGEE